MESMMIYVPVIMALLGLAFMWVKRSWVLKQDAGDGKMKEISDHIYEGALAFLKAEYRLLALFVVGASIALASISFIVPTTHILIVVAFIFGAFFSALAGNMGMKIATKTNVRTTQAARTSLPQALKVSFGGGTVMGLGVAGLAVLGLTSFFIFFFHFFMNGTWTSSEDMTIVLETLAGFSLGAESIALFARVGGGIYTKAADVGADLVGKVEAGIPEDDPRNPATIADNVGDNVGDVAGMGADLFGSYVATVLAAMVLGNYVIKDMGGNLQDAFGGIGPILLPMAIAGFGILFSIIGTMLVKISSNDAKEKQVQGALNVGNWVSIGLTLVACFFLVQYMLPPTMKMEFYGEGLKDISSMRVFYATIVGLTVGGVISSVTEYYTGLGTKPVLAIVQKSATGAGTNVIAGLATGMISTFPTVLLFAGAIWISYALAGFYGVALAASAMMATTAMQLAIDAFGPISDNAGGIAEMSELPKEVRTRTDILDSVGNTTAATGKGFAIASAALTSLALFAAYVTFTGIDGINIFKAPVLAMLFVGGMIPVVFSALAMNSVGKAAMDMVYEVRRQFKEIPGIMEGTGKPEYGKCVEISTKAALREMMLPGILTIGFPIAIVLLGKLVYSDNNQLIAEMLGGYMAGVTVSGVLWAIFQNNAGGAWDNAKKSFEAGVLINGEMTYKGSDAHKAAVTGDTVGDPFKDTSGPSMNILIKLTCLIGLVIAPILGGHSATSGKEACCAQSEMHAGHKMKCDMSKMAMMTKDECAKMCDEMGCSEEERAMCMSHFNESGKFIGGKGMKCDMSKCATMTKEECAKMCDDMGCSPEEKAMCLSHYDENGKFKGGECKMECCAGNEDMKNETMKRVSIEKETNNGKTKATVKIATVENGKETEKVETFEGTAAEVDAKIAEFKKE
ncbi:membrane-bound proton-translocating pyrophosphatase [Flavobacterium saliperosum S13]|uniref:Putative K(+)-stimulated pyrophosphate-energized sodium pump n=2 Tax=Flavobacterium saliperosum TaxID=329186 RepID=A0A1G4VVU3_9FLAO|nr:sodium-translocating pyrophosphatase [Flavobacterium saliperosum]ESU26747.1 membrane-bound proton-translocating pyrophosphatase [Flavobacterium saliperosum S13]SCX12672.1 K(+)-stimulated pyrophosphate-energized sodium pump [Flavobacterium saliperosum]